MIGGYVLIGTFAGLLTFLIAFLVGASFWLALTLYTLAGCAVLTFLPIAQIVVGSLVKRPQASTPADHQNEVSNLHATESSASPRGSALETSMRILAVDDDPFILELIPKISAKAGFSNVTPVTSGEQALRLLASTDTIFDCFLFDISMPGMDGIELCRQIRQLPQYCQTPIVMLTAMRDIKNMGEAFRAGATDYATKPFDVEELGKRLRSVQESITLRRETKSASQEDVDRSDLREQMHLLGVGSLVDYTVLSNYLTHFPRKELSDLQVFAVNIEQIEAVRPQSSYQQFVALLKDVAAAAAGCFGTDRTVMAYSNNATLLIATHSEDALRAIDIETDIKRRIQSSISDRGNSESAGIGVLVGGPVRLQGTTTQCARMAINNAIVLAENRALDKQGRTVVRLLKH